MRPLTPFISIGTKGTSFPVKLKRLEQPLVEGVNKIRWAGRGKNPVGDRAHAWVSKLKEPFELCYLTTALRDGKVRCIENVSWVHKGDQHRGTAYVKADWKPRHGQPMYVAVVSPTWPHGRVERDRIPDGRNAQMVATMSFAAVDTGAVAKTAQPADGPLAGGEDALDKQDSRTVPEGPKPRHELDLTKDVEAEIESCRHSFQNEPETEQQAIISARRGQGRFRSALKALWAERCAVTKCCSVALLRASHIKPWRDSTNAERLDRYNGLLLTPNLDAAFDAGFISFSDDGKMLISPSLSDDDAEVLGIRNGMRLVRVFDKNKPFFAAHRRLHGF